MVSCGCLVIRTSLIGRHFNWSISNLKLLSPSQFTNMVAGPHAFLGQQNYARF